MLLTLTVPVLNPTAVGTPTTDNVFPNTYALPPSIMVTFVKVPPALTVTLAVALTPIVPLVPTKRAL